MASSGSQRLCYKECQPNYLPDQMIFSFLQQQREEEYILYLEIN